MWKALPDRDREAVGEGPRLDPSFRDVFATLYDRLGIDVATTPFQDLAGRPQYLVGDHRPVAELVREAVAEYAAAHGSPVRPASVGIGRSGMGDLSERAEDLLEGMAEDR